MLGGPDGLTPEIWTTGISDEGQLGQVLCTRGIWGGAAEPEDLVASCPGNHRTISASVIAPKTAKTLAMPAVLIKPSLLDVLAPT